MENFLILASAGFFLWLYFGKGQTNSIAQDTASANNTAPFWFTAPVPVAPRTHDFASQPNYME